MSLAPPPRAVRRWIVRLIILAALAVTVFMAIGWARSHKQDLPWTKLDLTQPVGLFTGRKLVAARGDPTNCRRLLADAGIAHEVRPRRSDGEACTYDDAVRLPASGARSIALEPAAAEMSCPVAAGLSLWEWHVVQPAAARHLGSRITAIEHLGTYNCRRINRNPTSGWSEHATANAVDVAAFRTEDGRRISIVGNWNGTAAEQAFLREVRDGACDLFATVLSPDYNAAHADHLHLDQAARGARGWRGCR